MKSPKDRYENDPQYHQLCDMIENFLHTAQFSPSEVRECAVLACIHYEMKHRFNHFYPIPIKVNDALKTLAEYRKEEDTCPDCGRTKAKNAHECGMGYCPKWYAIRDKDAEKDCEISASKGKK